MPAADGDGVSSEPSISADGRYVAFRSEAGNLVFSDTNGIADVFVRDRVTDQTTRVSVSSGGGQANGQSSEPAISADGRYVAFTSSASDLVSGDSNGVADVFVRDLLAGETKRISLSSGGAQANGPSSQPVISADGRVVAFSSDASNLVSADGNAKRDVFVHSRVLGETKRVSIALAGGEANGNSSEPSISADAAIVAFTSTASNLVAEDSNAVSDVFMRTVSLVEPLGVGGGRDPLKATGVFGETTRVSLRSSGAQAVAASSEPSLSSDGRHVAFTSNDALDGGDQNGTRDVYVRDRTLAATRWASPGTSGSNGDSHAPVISAEGSYVVFVSGSPLRSGDYNGVADVYERELASSFTTRLSIDDDLPEANGASAAPAISGDATYAAFSSDASNLAADDSNGLADVLLHTWSAGSPVSSNGSPASTAEPSAQDSAAAGGGCGASVALPGENTRDGDAPTGQAAPVGFGRLGQRCDISPPISRGRVLPLGGCGEGDIAANPSACRSDPVNTVTGSYITQVKDLALPGIGLPFELVRTYNSSDPTVGPLGRGWTHSYVAFLSVRDAGAVVVARGATGQRLAFTRLPGGSYSPAPNGRARLATTTGGGYELTRRDQLRYRFEASGRLTAILDRNGRQLQLAYDTGGQLTKVTDTVGREVTLSYTGGMLTEVRLPDARKVAYAYTNGLLSAVTDVRGGITRYDYTGGRVSKVTDQLGHALITNVYGAGGRVVSQTDTLGKQTAFSWDRKTRTATVTDPRGKQWRDVYSSRQELVAESDPLGNKSSYTYDRDSNVIAAADPRGNTTEMTYDKGDNLLSETDALGNTEKSTYNERNDPVTHSDRRGFVTAYDYDGQGNLVKLTAPGGVATSFGRDPAGTGLLKSVTDPRGKTETYDHDAQGNLTSATSPKGFRSSSGYDGSGRLTSVTEPRGNVSGANPADYTTTFGYDAADHPTSQTDPLGRETKQTYDAAGNRKTKVDANNRTTSYGYDDLNRLKLVTAPDTTKTAYDHDATGQLTSRTDAKNNTTTYEYDAARRLVKKTSPAGHSHSYSYDAASNLTSRTDASGNTTTYEHDRLDRLAQIDYHSSSNEVAPGADPRDGVDVTTRQGGTPDVSFGYDENSNRILMRDGEGTESYAYDQLDRLSKLVRGSRAFSYDYDAASNLTQRRYPDGRSVYYAYDDDGRPATVTSAQKTTSYSYDAAGYRTATSLPNGFQETRDYDKAGRLTVVQNAKAGSVLSKFTYTLDAVGNPTQVQSPGATTTYSYDARYRLTEACYQASCPGGSDPFIRYAYDAVGNRTSETRPAGTTTYTHNTDDELTTKSGPSGTTNYNHDQNGNLTQAGPRTYSYDLAGRLTSTTAGADTTSYRYDGDGTRTQSATGAEKTQMVWDKNNALPQLIGEENAAGQAQRSYTHGAGEELISMTAGGQDHYYHRDAIGSTTNITAADGHAEWSYSYEPYGAARSTQHPDPLAPKNPIRYAGQRADDQSGLYHNRARDYDTDTGRFTATDPLPGATSTYAYANNNPIAFTDPSGMSIFGDAAGWIGDGVQGGLSIVGDIGGALGTAGACGADGLTFGVIPLGDLVDEKSTACAAGNIASLGIPIPGLAAVRIARGAAKAAKGGRGVVDDVARSACKVNSFAGDTAVLMADGTTRPIRDVELGDWVLAKDPITGETGARLVSDLIRHSGIHTMVSVRLKDGSTIDATDRHPIWVDSKGKWVDAIDLAEGDVVVTADGRDLAVAAIAISSVDLTAYNLTVEGLHTYFVGDDHVLVHNSQHGKGNVSGTPNPEDQKELELKRDGKKYDVPAAKRAEQWEKTNEKAGQTRRSRQKGC